MTGYETTAGAGAGSVGSAAGGGGVQLETDAAAAARGMAEQGAREERSETCRCE